MFSRVLLNFFFFFQTSTTFLWFGVELGVWFNHHKSEWRSIRRLALLLKPQLEACLLELQFYILEKTLECATFFPLKIKRETFVCQMWKKFSSEDWGWQENVNMMWSIKQDFSYCPETVSTTVEAFRIWCHNHFKGILQIVWNASFAVHILLEKLYFIFCKKCSECWMSAKTCWSWVVETKRSRTQDLKKLKTAKCEIHYKILSKSSKSQRLKVKPSKLA